MKNAGKIFSRDRKGIVDVQFNWIFIVIAGTVLFLFIISIVFSQKHNAETQLDNVAISQVATLIEGKQQSLDTYSEINLARTEIIFRCESVAAAAGGTPLDNVFNFKIGNSQRIPLPNSIIFAPKDMVTNKISVWTLPFSVGFSVDTFMYMITPDTIIVIYSDAATPSPMAKELAGQIPEKLNSKITTDPSDFSDYKTVKIVYIDGDPSAPPLDDIKDKYGYLLISPGLTPGSGVQLFDYGTVTFNGKIGSSTGSSVTYPYLAKAGLFAAIFSDDYRFYNCQMARVMNQVEIKRSLVQKRLELLLSVSPGPSDDCKIKYLQVVYDNEIIPMKNQLMTRDYIGLGVNAKNLDIRNNQLIINSCPKLY